MVRALIAGIVLISSGFAFAQSACETKCNQQASECIKSCAGDPKDAQKPEASQRLMQCLNQCEAQTKQCKAGCPKK